jgi:hypothetical protein
MRASSSPPRRDSDTHVMPLGAMLRLAAEAEGERLVRCPACVHPCVRPDELDDECSECGGLRMVTESVAYAWIGRTHVPAPESR